MCGFSYWEHFDDLGQDYTYSRVLVMELLQSFEVDFRFQTNIKQSPSYPYVIHVTAYFNLIINLEIDW